MFFNNRKVFCIGFNKTGTTSLHKFFQECNLKSTHGGAWACFSRIRYGKFYFRYQCYSDGEQSDFAKLDKWFPNSLFILNDRNEKDWLYSRIKHVLRHNEEIDVKKILSSEKYGKMAKDFFVDEESTINKWIRERRIYNKQARLYFDDKNNFLEIDITKDRNWVNKLIEYFQKNEFPINLNGTPSVIQRNKLTKNDLSNQILLSKYLNMVDNILDELK